MNWNFQETKRIYTMSDYHKEYTHKDVNQKIEAEAILLEKFAKTEAHIARNLSKVENITFVNDKNNPAAIIDMLGETKDLLESAGHIATKLHRIKHEEAKFKFFDLCTTRKHGNVAIANEANNESPEDQKIIRRESKVMKQIIEGEETSEDDQPIVQLACAHPRNTNLFRHDVTTNPLIRNMFVNTQYISNKGHEAAPIMSNRSLDPNDILIAVESRKSLVRKRNSQEAEVNQNIESTPKRVRFDLKQEKDDEYDLA